MSFVLETMSSSLTDLRLLPFDVPKSVSIVRFDAKAREPCSFLKSIGN